MADIIADWLEGWIQENLTPSGVADQKADMQQHAKRCATDASMAGFSIAQVKAAAGGDLEAYLVEQQNAATKRERSRIAQHRL